MAGVPPPRTEGTRWRPCPLHPAAEHGALSRPPHPLLPPPPSQPPPRGKRATSSPLPPPRPTHGTATGLPPPARGCGWVCTACMAGRYAELSGQPLSAPQAACEPQDRISSNPLPSPPLPSRPLTSPQGVMQSHTGHLVTCSAPLGCPKRGGKRAGGRGAIRGRPAVRGKRTYGGRPGQRVEEQGARASQKHSETGYGRPVDRGVWTAKNSQTTLATTSTSSIRQLLVAADAQTAHHATFSTAPTHQLLGSANAETTPARAPAAAANRK